MTRKRTAPPLTLTRVPGDDLSTIAADAENLALKLALRVRTATFNQDDATVRWLWKQLLSVERRYQERAGSTDGSDE